MAIIVEDGTQVANANSYVSVAELRDYAALRAVTLPVDDADVEPLLIKAMDYIESHGARFAGLLSVATQGLSFPRQSLYMNGELFADDAIPANLKKAQAALAIEALTLDLMPRVEAGQRIIMEKVGPLTTAYAAGGYVTYNYFPQVDALLDPLMRFSSLGRLTNIRT